MTNTARPGKTWIHQCSGERLSTSRLPHEGTGAWTIPDLPAGASATLDITATVLPDGPYENVAEVTAADQPDTDDIYGDGGGEDWEDVYNGTDSAYATAFIEDTFANNEINADAPLWVTDRSPEVSFFTGGGSKDTNGIQDGPWLYDTYNDVVPDKNDIVNAFAAAYTNSDGNGGTDTATITITITGVNDIPTAVNDFGAVTEDLTITINNSESGNL